MLLMGRNRYTPEQQRAYNQYLNSPLWRAKKAERINMAGGRCEWNTLITVVPEVRVRCERKRYLCVHHNTYERLGHEWASDLDVYCWFHHTLEHLLWKRCQCQQPCLGDEVRGTTWLEIVLASIGIDLDHGPVNWKNLPNKEFFLAQVPGLCPMCLDYLPKE
jgi:hypothetical protein